MVTPVIPADRSTLVRRDTDLDWRDYLGPLVKYDVYLGPNTTRFYTKVGSDLTVSELANPGSLTGLATYDWYYVAKSKSTYTSPVYSFTTGKL